MSTTTAPRIEDMDAVEARRVGLTIAEQQGMTPLQRARHAAAGRMVTPDMGDAPEGATHELVVPGAGLTIHIQGTDAEAQKLQLQWARKNGARIRRDGTWSTIFEEWLGAYLEEPTLPAGKYIEEDAKP